MQRFIAWSMGAVVVAFSASVSLPGLAAAEPARQELKQRFLEASLRVAEKELSQSQEALKRAPGSVTATEIERLQSNLEKTRAELALANAEGKAEEKSADNSAMDAIRHALDHKTEFEFVETPLADVIEYLAKKHNINIQLDKKALDNAGLGSDTPITRTLRDISLRSALRLILREFDLTWLIESEVLMITTIDEAGQRLDPQVYDVDDLVTIEGGLDYDSLIETITSIVAPTTWDDVGGPGSVAPLHRMLVISQTAEVHEQIASLLAELRRVRKARGDKIATGKSADAVPLDPAAVSVKVYKVSVPMMAKPSNKPIAVKPNAVGSAAVGGAEVLAQFGGGGSGRASGGGGMGGVVTAAEGTVPNDRYLEELVDAIPGLVQPDSWARNGGQGTIYALPADAAGNGQLLVRQTGEVHAQLQRFLNDLTPKSSASGMGGGGFF